MSTHRRRFLRLCGVAGLGAVAGCSGGSGDGETPADSETTTGPTGSLEQEAKLAADDGDANDYFGSSVALSSDGTTALIGAEVPLGFNSEKANSAYVFEKPGGSWSQQAKLAADDGDSDDGFSCSVALSSDGTTALVGAYRDDTPTGERAGSAYVFDRAGGSWTQQVTLAPDDGDSGDLFGQAVDLSNDGTTALISARVDDTPNDDAAGSTYVFDNSGGSWTQQAKFAADDGDSLDLFGWSVAISSDGTTALIGAREDHDPNGNKAGSAYVFENSGGSWTQRAKLAADDGDSRDQFGQSVALSNDGTTALIGARQHDTPNGDYAGSAYVFENSGGSWAQQTKVTADDGDSRDLFGGSVALSNDGTTALIGAAADDAPSKSSGSAYVFDNSEDSWTQRSKLAADDGDSFDLFGESVALSSDGPIALIGAPGVGGRDGKNPGSAYAFNL